MPTRAITGRAPRLREGHGELSARYPDDREAAVFYALALNMTLNPNDKTYANPAQGRGILEKVFAAEPQHRGSRTTDPQLRLSADRRQGADAARRYASIAPAAPHAQHMPRTSSREWARGRIHRFQPRLGPGRPGSAARQHRRPALLRVASRPRLHDVRLHAAREGP